MQSRARGSLVVASLAVLAMTAAACGGSSNNKAAGSSGTGSSELSNGLQALNGGGTPVKGGTLNMLGDGDVDWMDYNASYYSIGYLAQRLYLRGLYAYPAIPGKTTTVAADLATAMPTVTNGGKTYTVTIRSGR